MSDPLLCLTVSTTLREKPVTVTEARSPLVALLKAAQGSVPEDGPSTPAMQSSSSEDRFDSIVLEEINLFDGLSPGQLLLYVSHAPCSPVWTSTDIRFVRLTLAASFDKTRFHRTSSSVRFAFVLGENLDTANADSSEQPHWVIPSHTAQVVQEMLQKR